MQPRRLARSCIGNDAHLVPAESHRPSIARVQRPAVPFGVLRSWCRAWTLHSDFCAVLWDADAGELVFEPGGDALSRLGKQWRPCRVAVMNLGLGRLACYADHCASIVASEIFRKTLSGTYVAPVSATECDVPRCSCSTDHSLRLSLLGLSKTLSYTSLVRFCSP